MFMAREHHKILSPHIHFRDESHGEVKKRMRPFPVSSPRMSGAKTTGSVRAPMEMLGNICPNPVLIHL